MRSVLAWNRDTPHRCPACHVVAIDMERPRWWRVYGCCNSGCGAAFARWPRLAPLLPAAGVRCSEHRPEGRVLARWRSREILGYARDAARAAMAGDPAHARDLMEAAADGIASMALQVTRREDPDA